MAATKGVAVTEEIKDELKARKQSEYEPIHSVIRRLLDHSEATAAEREADPEDIAEEVTTALAQGGVPVVLAEGQLEKLRTVGE